MIINRRINLVTYKRFNNIPDNERLSKMDKHREIKATIVETNHNIDIDKEFFLQFLKASNDSIAVIHCIEEDCSHNDEVNN